MSKVPSTLQPFKILIFFSLLYYFPKKRAFKEPFKYTSWHTQAKTLITARQWRTTVFPFLCTAIKIAVSYSNRQFTHTTSQTTHITKGNDYCFCKLRAPLCCAALKCICPTNLIPQTARTAPLLEPLQSMRPHWGTPALEDSHRQVEGHGPARARCSTGSGWAPQGPAIWLSTAGDTKPQAILSHKASLAKASPSTLQWRKTVPSV